MEIDLGLQRFQRYGLSNEMEAAVKRMFHVKPSDARRWQ